MTAFLLAATEMFAPNLKGDPMERQLDITVKQEKEKFNTFLNAIAQRESSMNPNAINFIGAMGKYQFLQGTLNFLGFDTITVKRFTRNPGIFPADMQDDVMLKLLNVNKKILLETISKHKSTVVKDFLVTESGILAAAHLAGAFGVKDYFNSNTLDNPSDANGTSLEDYLKRFSGYNLDFIVYNPLNVS